MFGRRVTVLLRFPAPARLPAPIPFQCQHDLPTRTLLGQSRRSYATPGRPRKAVGEPSRPVKRAVKRSAAAATSPDSPAKQKNEAKKEKAAKNPAAKKPAVKKAAAEKAAPRKVLTEEQKAAKAASLEKAKIVDLKKAALEPPKFARHLSAYNMFVTDKGEALKGSSGTQIHHLERLKEFAQGMSAQWKEMSPADLEHYNHLAHTRTEAAEAGYKCWVESHTPEQIRAANLVRASLRRKFKGDPRKKTSWPAIRDGRIAKRPLTPYLQFNVNRQASGDFKNIALPERSKLLAQEWKALSESEKNKYKALHTEDTKRYAEEVSNVYGHALPTANGEHQPQAAAAAV
ncbi:hypothetical protein LTR36_001100 [Oleoguttula mirabilis]|uniref:HMG box domain-containing protein n=1 Tax=Oleoguttula mirabilis TaxID=1507867 RepID=A0AAV9JPU5_9PEZI|nr:hypothetical protein LTR36_001100 [Oleoguttula mirabilis]